jgi:hypothetical protein
MILFSPRVTKRSAAFEFLKIIWRGVSASSIKKPARPKIVSLRSTNFQNNTFIACFIFGFLLTFIGGADINHAPTAKTSASKFPQTSFYLGSSWICFST